MVVMPPDIAYDYDIIIAGGGAVGATLACALAKDSELRIAIIEAVAPTAEPKPSYDDRGLALSLTSKNILDKIGIWSSIAPHANPIRHIHVSDQHHFGFVRMDAHVMAVPAFAYVVLADALGKSLLRHIEQSSNISLISPASVVDLKISDHLAKVTFTMNGSNKELTSKILIGADGVDSKTRTMLGIGSKIKDYQQTAIVSHITAEKPHHNTAYERFTTTGPIALLPYSQQCLVLVFTVAVEQADKYLHMDKQSFLDSLLDRFGYRLGKFSGLERRTSYPLRMSLAEKQIQHRAVIIGNAAHTVHPNGAQGLNLGLRDAATLAEKLLMAQSNNLDLGELAILNTYLAARIKDQQRVIHFTDRLAQNFYNDQPCRIIARNMAMLAIDLIPPLKHRFILNAMGFHGLQSYLAY